MQALFAQSECGFHPTVENLVFPKQERNDAERNRSKGRKQSFFLIKLMGLSLTGGLTIQWAFHSWQWSQRGSGPGRVFRPWRDWMSYLGNANPPINGWAIFFSKRSVVLS